MKEGLEFKAHESNSSFIKDLISESSVVTNEPKKESEEIV
jgi:hypothetical protein